MSDESPKKPSRPRRRRPVVDQLPALATVDMRTRSARLARDVRNELYNDLGGEEHLPKAKRVLADKAALLHVITSADELARLEGQPAMPLTEYVTCVNALNRLLSTLGLERKMRPVGPTTLSAYRERRGIEKAFA